MVRLAAIKRHPSTYAPSCQIFLQWLSMVKNTPNSILLLEPVISHTLDDSQIRNQHIAFTKPFMARIDAANEFLICNLSEKSSAAIVKAPFVIVFEYGGFNLQ